MSELPSYMTSQLGFSLTLAGELCIVPYAALFIATMGFGELFAHLQTHYDWETRTVRQVAQCIAFVGSSAALVVCSYIESPYGAFACLVIAQVGHPLTGSWSPPTSILPVRVPVVMVSCLSACVPIFSRSAWAPVNRAWHVRT